MMYCNYRPIVHIDFTPNETLRPHSVGGGGGGGGGLCFSDLNNYNKHVRFAPALWWLLLCKRVGYFPLNIVKLCVTIWRSAWFCQLTGTLSYMNKIEHNF